MLVQIVAPTGDFISLQRDAAGQLVQVTDPQARQLRLRYATHGRSQGSRFHGAITIDSPVGQFRYAYDGALPAGATQRQSITAAKLIRVDFPDGDTGRHYHYEDARRPTYLTGISASSTNGQDTGEPMTQRVGTYLYDIDGKAILSVRGLLARLQRGADRRLLQPARLEPGTGIDQVTLDFSVPGRTVIANALGQTTTYRHAIVAGEYRVLEAIGPGCHQCGETNVRYAWLTNEHLASITRLSEIGALPVSTIFYAYDRQGRPTAVSRQSYSAGGKPVCARLLSAPGVRPVA